MNVLFPWMGGKGKLLWLIFKLAPPAYDEFFDVFGGGGTVTLNHPRVKDCRLTYNDYDSNLANFFYCAKERPLALTKELGFIPLKCRDEFPVLLKFLSQEEFTSEYLEEELEIAQTFFPPEQAAILEQLILERAEMGDVRKAAAFFKVGRYSFNGNGKSVAAEACDIRKFFYLIWRCSRIMKDVWIENKDFEELIVQNDRKGVWFYCDPPYLEAEDRYKVEFGPEDHIRLHETLSHRKGYVMVSYNNRDFIRELYQDFFIFGTERHDSMSHKEGQQYGELIMTNYDPRLISPSYSYQTSLLPRLGAPRCEKGEFELIHEPT